MVIKLLATILFSIFTLYCFVQFKKYRKIWALPLGIVCAIVTLVMIILVKQPLVVLGILGVVMIWALMEQKSKGAQWGRPLAGVCSVLAVVIAVGVMGYQLFGCEGKKRRNQAEYLRDTYNEAKNKILADHLKEKHSGAKAVIVQYAHQIADQDAEHKILEDALGSEIKVLRVEGIGPSVMSEDDMMFEEGFMFTQKELAELIEFHEEADLFIMYTGMPYDIYNAEPGRRIWDMPREQLPKFVLISGGTGVVTKTLLKADLIAAAIFDNPKWRYDLEKELPKDYKKVFDDRYLLITGENVDEMLEQHPKLMIEKGEPLLQQTKD